MNKETSPNEILEQLKQRLSKRAKVVVEHIQKHGIITTEELEKNYGYKHPPRAARDVREAGIPLESINVKSTDGRTIGAYKFGDLSQIQKDKLGGRVTFSKQLKDELYEISRGQCAICAGHFESRYLQIDHKVPYEVAGDNTGINKNRNDYMLLCASCNRAKSWSCEHCPNWLTEKSLDVCALCYWASPDNYQHIACREVRRMDILWEGLREIQVYEKIKTLAQKNGNQIPDYVKKLVRKCLKEGK
jgi:5-methylcytosine-specific restriction endonuclease McrA